MNLYNGFRLLYRQKVVGVNSFDGVPLKALFSVRKADYVVEGLYINWMNCDSQQMCLNLWLFVETLKNPSPCFTWLFPFKESQKHLSDSKHVPQIRNAANQVSWLVFYPVCLSSPQLVVAGGCPSMTLGRLVVSSCEKAVFLCIVGSANAVVIWWSINKIELNYFLQ